MSAPRTRSQRVRLDSVRSLVFYADEETAARRSSPIPQLTCVGKPCRRYRPDVVRCTSISPSGTSAADIEWSCEAELPSSMRLGRVEVSCEGYDRPGDDYVLKGSCGLKYNLLSIDPSLESDFSVPGRMSSTDYLVPALAIALALWIAWNWWKAARGDQPAQRRGGGGNGPPWNPFNRPGGDDPPPPYSKQQQQQQGWRPGFMTGALAGAAGAHLLNRNRGGRDQTYVQPRRPTGGYAPQAGPSGGGGMRTSTGFGGTSIR